MTTSKPQTAEFIPYEALVPAANKITLTSPTAAGQRAMSKDAQLRVDPSDGGSGPVTFRAKQGAGGTKVWTWVLTFDSTYGSVLDLSAVRFSDYSAPIIFEVERTGLTSGAIVAEFGLVE